jgi:hypothetical protein
MAVTESVADDLMNGAEEIGQFMGESPRRTYYLLERGLIPGFKLGSKWQARKSTLIKYIEKLEEGAAR